MKPVKVGILGCGKIAPAYLRNLTNVFTSQVEVVACADLMSDLAEQTAKEFNIPRACTPDALLGDPEIELVLNLTPAAAHHALSVKILKAGKHLFTEKPLALQMDHVQEIVETAAAAGLQIGGAADTFLGSSLQLCRRLIDEGRIGQPIAATSLVSIGAFNRERYHTAFRGALLDLGPYYLTALIALLGPVRRTTGTGEVRFPEREGPEGKINVTVPTTTAGVLDFSDGTVAAVLATGDVDGYFPRTEIHGTEGTLIVSDANAYQDKVILRKGPDKGETFVEAPGFSGPGRGLGVAEMAMAIRENRPPRAGADLLVHVTEIMLAIEEASHSNQHVMMKSTCSRPAPFVWKG